MRVNADARAAGRQIAMNVPADGANCSIAFSALMRHSMAWPLNVISSWSHGKASPAATRICSDDDIDAGYRSVTGCSTWIRVLASMK